MGLGAHPRLWVRRPGDDHGPTHDGLDAVRRHRRVRRPWPPRSARGVGARPDPGLGDGRLGLGALGQPRRHARGQPHEPRAPRRLVRWLRPGRRLARRPPARRGLRRRRWRHRERLPAHPRRVVGGRARGQHGPVRRGARADVRHGGVGPGGSGRRRDACGRPRHQSPRGDGPQPRQRRREAVADHFRGHPSGQRGGQPRRGRRGGGGRSAGG
mmetsp:Transcript_31286/g.74353  ORF Transcript_31286/g.74353 Transcript_31286/m.74353 type:complete len:213 (+) Transcript_31286:1110-1748(+)